jgi:hypothetical protein
MKGTTGVAMADHDLERRRAGVLALLPETVRQAVVSRDLPRLNAELAALEPREAAIVVQQLRDVGILAGGRAPDEVGTLLEDFGPLLADIVAVARGDASRRAVAEQVLEGLQEAGWQLYEPVVMLWDGERSATRLTEGLEDEEAILLHRVLELLA